MKRILVGLSGTEYTVSAINQAVALAKDHDSELTGVSILDRSRLENVGPVPIGGAHYARELVGDRMEKAKERIERSEREFTQSCRAAGIRHQVLREIGEPLSLLIEQARYNDLMVFGLRSLFEFGLVADPHDALVRLVQSGVRPLLAVARHYSPVRKVMIAYSGSMESARAMKRFVQMRLWPSAVLRIVTFEYSSDIATGMVNDAADYCRSHGFDVEVAVIPGSAKDQLLAYAEAWGADLIVVGNSAKNLLVRRIFGETALNTIRHSNRPLFLAQ